MEGFAQLKEAFTAIIDGNVSSEVFFKTESYLENISLKFQELLVCLIKCKVPYYGLLFYDSDISYVY